MTFAQNLDRAAGAAVCNWLGPGGGTSALMPFVVAGLMTPGGQVPAAAAGLGLLALNIGCAFDPNGIADGNQPYLTGCSKVSSGYLFLVGVRPAGQGGNFEFVTGTYWVEILSVERIGGRWEISYRDTGGRLLKHYASFEFTSFTTRLAPGAVCAGDGSGGIGPAPHLPPYRYDGGDAECDMDVEFQAWLQESDGTVRPVLKISAASPAARASGGVISGCNFAPVLYVGGGGGGGDKPPWWTPFLPGPDGPNGEPWWWRLLKGIGDAALEFAVAAVLQKTLDAFFAEKLPGTVYRLTGVCETNAQGEPIDVAREKVIPELPILEGIAARLDALPTLTQGLKDLKQPTCPAPLHAPYDGPSITVRFLSTENTPDGGRPLRKDFSYRDRLRSPLEDHAAHWLNFTWASGPWIVFSTGMPWGKPRVWAASPQEGERVLRHAAAIAGVDLDSPAHQFVSRETFNNRHRYSFNMRLRRDANGRPWVTTRDDADGFPEISSGVGATLKSSVDSK